MWSTTGFILPPIPFTLYTADIGRLISSFGLKHHCYADDTQIHGSCSLTDCGNLESKMLDCIQSVEQWMSSNRLRLNLAKSEFMWCCTSCRLHLADTSRFNLPDGDVEPSERCFLWSGNDYERTCQPSCQNMRLSTMT